MQHFGRIDIHGLISWRDLSPRESHHGRSSFSQDKNVKRASDRWWVYHRGSEYLAANPLYIPGLTPILRDAVQDDPKFNAQNGAFAIPQVR